MAADENAELRAAIGAVEWRRLLHAYGRATDTPGHLRALLEGDEAAAKRAMEHLWSAVLHQGTPWLCTRPVAQWLQRFVASPAFTRFQWLPGPVIDFLVEVANVPLHLEVTAADLREAASFNLQPWLDADDDEALYEDPQASTALSSRALLDCVELGPALLAFFETGLDHAMRQVRVSAAMGASLLMPALAPERVAALQARLQRQAEACDARDERAALVMALGQTQASTATFLDDPAPGVVLCAALAPALLHDARAAALLLEMLERQVSVLETWFDEPPPQFSMRLRFSVIERVLAQQTCPEAILGAWRSVLQVANGYTVDRDWGPMLAFVFREAPGVLGPAQREALQLLVDTPSLWDPKLGNALSWFRAAGLPADREACRALLTAPA